MGSPDPGITLEARFVQRPVFLPQGKRPFNKNPDITEYATITTQDPRITTENNCG